MSLSIFLLPMDSFVKSVKYTSYFFQDALIRQESIKSFAVLSFQHCTFLSFRDQKSEKISEVCVGAIILGQGVNIWNGVLFLFTQTFKWAIDLLLSRASKITIPARSAIQMEALRNFQIIRAREASRMKTEASLVTVTTRVTTVTHCWCSVQCFLLIGREYHGKFHRSNRYS